MNEYILLIYIYQMLYLYNFFNSKKIKVRELVKIYIYIPDLIRATHSANSKTLLMFSNMYKKGKQNT
jgi:hypothetical protein